MGDLFFWIQRPTTYTVGYLLEGNLEFYYETIFQSCKGGGEHIFIWKGEGNEGESFEVCVLV